jgi:hypothetical protein
MRYYQLINESFDEPDEPAGSFGWWIFPDGRVEEIEEAGNHGWVADQWLSDQMAPERPYDEAIDALIEQGGVRVATFHGSDSMGLNLPPTLAPVVRTALLRLLKDTRADFAQYYIGDQTPKAYDFRGAIAAIRQAP